MKLKELVGAAALAGVLTTGCQKENARVEDCSHSMYPNTPRASVETIENYNDLKLAVVNCRNELADCIDAQQNLCATSEVQARAIAQWRTRNDLGQVEGHLTAEKLRRHTYMSSNDEFMRLNPNGCVSVATIERSRSQAIDQRRQCRFAMAACNLMLTNCTPRTTR